MADELQEVIGDKQTVVVIEWGGAISSVLPSDRLSIDIQPISETVRRLDIVASGKNSMKLLKRIES
jgi:tRNA A37 threonylcarbamoyladenosine biosynthesis protein TsaE